MDNRAKTKAWRQRTGLVTWVATWWCVVRIVVAEEKNEVACWVIGCLVCLGLLKCYHWRDVPALPPDLPILDDWQYHLEYEGVTLCWNADMLQLHEWGLVISLENGVAVLSGIKSAPEAGTIPRVLADVVTNWNLTDKELVPLPICLAVVHELPVPVLHDMLRLMLADVTAGHTAG